MEAMESELLQLECDQVGAPIDDVKPVVLPFKFWVVTKGRRPIIP